jgi:hypothetical protein
MTQFRVFRRAASARLVSHADPNLGRYRRLFRTKYRRIRWVAMLAVAGVLLSANVVRADNLYGRIRGIVRDPSGAGIAGAKVVATNTATGLTKEAPTESDGSYEILQLAAPAVYTLTTEVTGFRKFEARGIQLNVNQVFVEHIKLELGTLTETVTVSEAGQTQVEATSIELGVTVNDITIVNMPLNGREWDQLQQLEPGVVANSDARFGPGYQNKGNYSTNGSQPDQNSYLVNGTDNNDLLLNQVQTEPSPDAIAEFKMVTSTFNPEYGRNSGAIMNLIIKSGTNQFHGDGFDFYRDTSLNARNFFQPKPDVFHQNQFGGTLGGPIWKDHTFFFFSYEGTRVRQEETANDCGCSSPGNTPVFTPAERNGQFPDLATSTGRSAFPLIGENGAIRPAGTPYSAIFPTGHIPGADINPVAANLLNYVPLPNVGSNYEFNPTVALVGDQYLGRIDHAISSKDAVWLYGLWERQRSRQDLPFFTATLPGFGQVDEKHWQQYTLGWNHTLSGDTLNEARVAYTRLNWAATMPANPASPASAGFTGITPQMAGSSEGLPGIFVTGFFNLGFSTNGPQPRVDQTYELTDNLSKIAGRHALKFGFDMRRFEVYNAIAHLNNGGFAFAATGSFTTGNEGADFLLGVPDFYEQASGDILNERARQYYSYAQDQWKARSNLTITYGLGWSVDTPLADNYHNNHAGVAFRPGQQSIVFPEAPKGYVFQGDPGVNAFGTAHFKDFGPRFGFAYSPDWGRLTGGPGKTSIRAGYGIYYNRFSGEPTYESQGLPPFGVTSFGAGDIGASPSFANPFSGFKSAGGAVTPVSIPNKFPYVLSGQPDFSFFEPMAISVYDPNVSIPYAENYTLTAQRQIGASSVVSIGYVGAQGHRLLITHELNPGLNPAGCAATPACASDPAFQPFLFPGNYAYPGNVIASIGEISTIGNSNYNSLQMIWDKRFSHGLQFLAAYTWSHSLDDGSGFENTGFNGGGFGGFGNIRSIDPFNQKLRDYGNSIFDARHRFVISYVYKIPSARHFHALQFLPSKVTDGWQMSGITTFQSGFPLDVVDSSLPSLTDSSLQFYCTPGVACWDVPNVAGPVQYENPRASATNLWFSPSAFAPAALGTQGNAGRDILRGPGINNFDFALMKDTSLTENTRIELRFEFFNFLNHTQFDPIGITTDINSATFGQELSARAPRLIQLAGKFYF